MNKEQALSKAKLFRQFIADRTILVIDTNTSAAEAMKSMLESLGAKGERILCSPDFDSAKAEVEMFRPSVVISDFNLGERRGLELAAALEEQIPEAADRLFILLTTNTQQEAIARGAEGEVDASIARPIQAETFKPAFVRIALQKLQPMESESPTMACHKQGREYEALNQPEKAEALYLQGLILNPLHRKCMTGLFEVLHAQKKSPQAYEMLRKLAETYTLSTDQLSIALRMAVQQRHFEDIDLYFDIFSKLDSHPEELVRFLCPALVVAGKHHLQHGMTGRAVEAFRKAAVAADGRTRILREIISSLLDAKLIDQAEEIFQQHVPKTAASLDVQVMEFMIMDHLMESDQVIERGQDLLWNKINDPTIYRILIKRSREAGQNQSAEEMTAEALQRWPEFKDAFHNQ